MAINDRASQEQKETYLPKFYTGEWSGTMCLTEPHSGTDLGIIKTKAEPNEDGSYNITGTKIFITSGEHDLSENIIHLVLAKTPNAPAGSRGISRLLSQNSWSMPMVHSVSAMQSLPVRSNIRWALKVQQLVS